MLMHPLAALAATSELLLGSIDAWPINQPTLFTRNKILLPAAPSTSAACRRFSPLYEPAWLAAPAKVKTLSEILAADHDEQPGNSNGKAEP
jgi:hypothetical protein